MDSDGRQSVEGSCALAEDLTLVETAILVDNVATKALLELLSKGNVAVKTDDYGGFEKVVTFLAAGKVKTDIVLSLK